MSTAERYPVVVVGGGPAGLATSAELRRRGIEHVVLERGDTVGYSWAQPVRQSDAAHGEASVRPPANDVRSARAAVSVAARLRGLPASVRRSSWSCRSKRGGPSSRSNAAERRVAGANGPRRHRRPRRRRGDRHHRVSPRLPVIPGRERFRGRVMHSVEYRRPAGFAGRRVLVVGVGNSGGEIASELANAGARVTVAVRSGANVVPRQIAGIPIQYVSFAMRALPRRARNVIAALFGRITELRRGKPVLPRPAHGPLDAIPLIGFHLVDAIRAGKVTVRGGVTEFTEQGARFTAGVEEPFDDVILATGFTAALAPLGAPRSDGREGVRRARGSGDQRRPSAPVLRRALVRRDRWACTTSSATRRWRRSGSRRALVATRRSAPCARRWFSTCRPLVRTPSSWRFCCCCSLAASLARCSPRRRRRRGCRRWPAGTPGSCRIATCCRRRSCFWW